MPDGSIKPVRSKLRAVPPDSVEPKKPKLLIFGPPGVGKTWTALDFPNCYYIDTEGGADLDHYRQKLKAAGGVYLGPDEGSLDFDTVISQIQALSTERHPYRTVIFDSITKLWNTAISEEADRLGDKDVFGASKKPAVRRMNTLIRWVLRLDMNAIFIAHQKDLWGKDDKGNREAIGLTYDGYEKLEYDLHLALRISKIGAGEGAKRFAHIGKSRLFNFPEGTRFDWSYAEFAERYGREVIEKEVQPLVLATAEQVAELKRLLEIVKLPDGTTDKWLKKAEVDTFEEMDGDILLKCIAALKERMVAA